MTNEETLGLLTILLSEIIAMVLFLDATLENNSLSEITIHHITHQQDHIQDLLLHLECLLIIYNQIPLKIMTTTRTTAQSRKTNLKVICKPLK